MMADDRRLVVEDDNFYMTDAVTDRAIAMIGSAKAQKPFFLYLAYTAPHWPLHAPAADIARYEGCYRQGWDHARGARHERLVASGLFRRPWALSPRDPKVGPWDDAPHKDWEAMRMAVYAAMVDRMDRCIGRLLDHLTRTGSRDETLVLFLSDNGGCAKSLDEEGIGAEFPDRLPDGRPIMIGNRPDIRPGDRQSFMSYGRCWSNLSNVPFRLHKSWVHEGGVSTPLIVNWPGRIVGGQRLDDPAHVIDLMPTILEAGGAAMPAEVGGHPTQALDGMSLLGPLTGGGQLAGRRLFWEHGGHAAARIGNLKLVRERGQAWELYDMDEDRTELNDLAPAHPADVARLDVAWRDWSLECGVEPWPQVRRRLRGRPDAG
jgi:arylsulfatase